MLIGIYTEPLNKDKLNTQHFIQCDRKLKFMRNKRAISRSFGRWRGQKELKTTGTIVLDLTESQELDIVILLEPMDRGFFISCHS